MNLLRNKNSSNSSKGKYVCRISLIKKMYQTFNSNWLRCLFGSRGQLSEWRCETFNNVLKKSGTAEKCFYKAMRKNESLTDKEENKDHSVERIENIER